MTGAEPPPPPGTLPDDFAEKLINGQRLRATHDLMQRRQLTVIEVRTAMGSWLSKGCQVKADGPY